MQAILFESVWLVVLGGLVSVGIAGFVWTQTWHKAALFTAIGLALVTALITTISLQVETDRERIYRTLVEVADALQHNDRARVIGFIHPNAVDTVRQAENELPRYEFLAARVTRVREIAINRQTQPPTAIAEFNVYAEIYLKPQTFKVPRFVKVYFMQRDGNWLVRDYEHYEPTAGFRDSALGL